MFNVVKRPIVSEKSMALAKIRHYSFEVARNVTKDQIAKAIMKRFSVSVVSVKTINSKPKSKMQRSRRGRFFTKASKKAIVEVKKGQKIPIFEAVQKDAVEVKTAETEIAKEKKSLLRGTKVKVEKVGKAAEEKSAKPQRDNKKEDK